MPIRFNWKSWANADNEKRCSFCRKSQDVVGKLISSPSDYPRAYICDGCIGVCNSVIDDDQKPDAPEEPVLQSSPMDELMNALRTWVDDEIRGVDSLESLAEVRRLALTMLPYEPEI